MKLLLLLFPVCLVQVQTLPFNGTFLTESSLGISKTVFELLNMYFSWVFDVYVYDFNEKDSPGEQILDSLLIGAFENCEIMTIVRKIEGDHLLESDFFSEHDRHPENQQNGNLTKIRVKSVYGIGAIYVSPYIMTLQRYLEPKEKFTCIIGEDSIPTSCCIVVIVTEPCHKHTMHFIRYFLKRSWYQHFVTNVMVILHQCEMIGFFDVIANKVSFVSYNDEDRIKDLISFETLDYMNYPIRVSMFSRFPTVIGQNETEKLVLPSYIPKMFNVTQGYTGIDAIILANLVEKLRFKLVLNFSEDFHYGDPNQTTGEYTGTLGDVIYNYTDIAINGRYLRDYETGGKIKFLTFTNFDRICVITPKAQLIPKWKTPLLIFEPTSWLGLALLNFGASLFLHLFSKSSPRTHFRHRTYSQSYIDVNLLMLSQPLAIIPRLRSWEKLIIVPFLFASFYISGIIQALLTSVTSKAMYEKEIETYAELEKINLPIVTGSTALTDLFGDDPTGIIKSLDQKLLFTRERPFPALYYTAVHRNSCSIERELDATLTIKRSYTNDYGKPLLNIMAECPRAYFIGSVVRKGWPFIPDFKRNIRRFFEHGFTRKWYDDIQNSLIGEKLIQKAKDGFTEDEQAKPLTMSSLIAPFYILGIGLAFGTFVFLLEFLSTSKLMFRKV